MYEVERLPQNIDIGFTGEIEFRTVEIDMSAWVAKVPDGQPTLMYIRPSEYEPYPVETTFEDNILTWSVSDEDLGTKEGTGLLQVWFGVEDEEQVLRQLGMSAVVATIVHLSLAGEGNNSSTVQIPWLKEVMEMKNIILGYDYEAESWAVGKRGGTDVSSTDPAYHNNAKYFSEQASAAKTAAEAAQEAAETAAERDVEAWLEENFTNPDSPPLDRTLALDTAAAPADMVGNLKSAINTLYMCKIPLESGGWSSNGNTKSDMVSRLRNVYPISREVFKSITLPQGYSASGYTLDETYTKLGTLSYSNSHDLSGMAQDVKYINLSIRKDDSASSNISSYCDTVQSGTVAVLIDSYNISALQTGVADLQSGALQYRGSISDLGYTSVAQCTKTGFYKFLSSDVANLSDLPTGWTSGGYILVYKLPNGAWQYIGNNRNRYIRSGLSGVWYPDVMVDATLTKADVAADAKATGDVFRYLNVLKKRKLVYNVASYAKSNARLRIYIPQESGYLLIDMRHYYYNDDTGKADCWGIDNAFACDDNRTQLFQITNGGEWECAVRVKDGQDFSGGGTHGDEYNAVTTFFIDGMPVDITTYTSVTDFKELKIVQESELYTPTENGNQTKIATHGTEWIFNENGIKISQYLKWEPSVNIAIAYMCMFPVAKTSSYNDGTIKIVDRIFTDTGYDVYTPTNNTSKRWQGASVVDAYCTESKVHCKISPIEYVKNLTGGNVVSETDNGGLNYFKLYWSVVNSGDYTVTGHTTESGELWKSVVEYSISLT